MLEINLLLWCKESGTVLCKLSSSLNRDLVVILVICSPRISVLSRSSYEKVSWTRRESSWLRTKYDISSSVSNSFFCANNAQHWLIYFVYGIKLRLRKDVANLSDS